MTANLWTTTKAQGPGNYWNVYDPDGNFVCFAREPDAKRIVDGLNQRNRLCQALRGALGELKNYRCDVDEMEAPEHVPALDATIADAVAALADTT